MSKSGLKRRATFEEALHLPGPNLDLPQRIASQMIDSPYLIKQMGDDMGAANDLRQEREDEARAVERHAQQQNVPLAELRAVVAAMRPATEHNPFFGQAAHEARAAQQEILAKLEAQRVGLFTWFRDSQTARVSEASLLQQGQTLAQIAQQMAQDRKRGAPSSGEPPSTRSRGAGSGGATSSRGM